MHPERARVAENPDGPFAATGELLLGVGSPLDLAADVAQYAKVSRDRDGKVIWDPKNALIGGIVVAILVGLIAAYIGGVFMSSNQSRYTSPTTVTISPHR